MSFGVFGNVRLMNNHHDDGISCRFIDPKLSTLKRAHTLIFFRLVVMADTQRAVNGNKM